MILLADAGSPPDVEIHERNDGPQVAWEEPEGEPRGVIMLLPGGGWKQPTRRAFSEQKQAAANLGDEGYATVVVRYDAGALGFHDVEEVYERARERYPRLPICASGISAGGHLALMLATRNPDLACVVVLAGPADLTSLQEQGSSFAHRKAVDAFGKEDLAKWSPVRDADQIEAKVLMVLAPNDPVNPVEQGEELERALPSAQVFTLDADPQSGRVALFHFAKVAPQSVEDAGQRVVDFLADVTQGN